MSYLSRIDHAFSDAPVLPLSENGRYGLFSDCHRGRKDRRQNTVSVEQKTVWQKQR